MGQHSLGVIDCRTLESLAVIPDFSPNDSVRKMVGLSSKPWVLLLEVEKNKDKEKNVTYLTCFDIEKQSSVFSNKCHLEINDKGAYDFSVYRFTKSFELSVDESMIFSVGIYVDGMPDEPRQRGFLSAMQLGADLKEEAFHTIEDATSEERKGMYRVSRCSKEDILIVGAWVDVFVYCYNSQDKEFVHLHSFLQLHHSFIYNVVSFDRCFFTCSNDCEASLIKF